jgi:glycosyltransferase involved in cell wall biosynthesis
MRVYFITSGLQGCYFVRCLMPLTANGWDGDITSIHLGELTPEDKTRAANDADIVVFHRPEQVEKLELAKILKQKGKKIVFDNDDTFKDDGGYKLNKFMDQERMDKGMKKVNAVLDEFIGIADMVTCSTEFLKQEYLKLNDNVKVIPNLIDPFYYDEPLKNETDVVRIGIVGSIAITSDMEVLQPIVEHYKDDSRVKFVLFSLPPNKEDKIMRELYFEEYKFWESLGDKIEWQPLVPMDVYYDTLNNLKLDLMIIPRADNYFNRCKSNIKFLEASMFEIPVIAQGFESGDSPYQVNPDDRKHMSIAYTKDDFINFINHAITTSKKSYIEMGKDAKKYVLENYNIETKGHLWEDAYQELIKVKRF